MSRSRVEGGAPARRAVVRWARRLVRRDWRQYALITVLMTVVVTASVVLPSATYNIAAVDGQSEFGNAREILFLVGNPSSAEIDEWVDAGVEAFGTIDVIGNRLVGLPGTTAGIEYRAADVDGPYGAPMLDVLSGRAPSGPDEVAVTDGVAALLSLAIGDTLDLDGTPRQVVGSV